MWGKIAIELSMAAKPAQRVANPLSLFGNRPAFVVNAAARAEGMTYGEFMHGLKLAGVDINRKLLADMAVREPEAFSALVTLAKSQTVAA